MLMRAGYLSFSCRVPTTLRWATEHRAWSTARAWHEFQDGALRSVGVYRSAGRPLADFRNPWPGWGAAVQWRQGDPAGSVGVRMTTLDHRLYTWLAEPDERRFER